MSALGRFAQLVSGDTFDLAEASLLVAEDVYPGVNLARYLGELDRFAAAIRARLPADAFVEQKLAALNYYLFSELQFSGNVDDYYDPKNSYLNEVIDRRTGIPLTLSLVYLEVGRRLGLDLKGVSFPGHFLVKLAVRGGQLVLDPFLAGETQSESQLRERLATVLPAPESADIDLARYLHPATPRQILARLLRNLKNIYVKAEQHERTLQVLNRMVLVLPESAEQLRDRGLVYESLECFRPALADLQEYLRRRPQAPDSAEMQAKATELARACARLN